MKNGLSIIGTVRKFGENVQFEAFSGLWDGFQCHIIRCADRETKQKHICKVLRKVHSIFPKNLFAHFQCRLINNRLHRRKKNQVIKLSISKAK
jgi:hypothetical protein